MKTKKIIGALMILAVVVLWLTSVIMEYGVFEGILRCLLTFGVALMLVGGWHLLKD